MVYSAFNAMKIVIPMMVKQGHGTIIVSGATASLRAGANFSAFASAKFALRGLTQSVAREYQKQGVHVAHVILDGILDTRKSRELHAMDPADMMSTYDVAEAYMQIIKQKPSAWTHELDLRPKNETF
jgi:short-subunit dehydrogenase